MSNIREEYGYPPNQPWSIEELLVIYKNIVTISSQRLDEILGLDLRPMERVLPGSVRGHVIHPQSNYPYLLEARSLSQGT